MKNRIWVWVIVLLIVSIGAASGYCVGKSIDRFAEQLSQPAEYPDVNKGTFSMFAKIGISKDQLSRYSSIEEAILHIDEPIRIDNIGFTSEEVTAMLNVSKDFLKSMYVSSIVFTIQPDDTVHFDVFIDAEELRRVADLPAVALSIIQNTKFTFLATIEGVSENGKLMIKVNDIYVKDVHVMNFINLFNLGSDVRGFVSEFIGKTIDLRISVLENLKSFTISDGLAYIDATLNFGGTAGD